MLTIKTIGFAVKKLQVKTMLVPGDKAEKCHLSRGLYSNFAKAHWYRAV